MRPSTAFLLSLAAFHALWLLAAILTLKML